MAPLLLNTLENGQTCTPKIPKIMKNVQQMRTMFPMGFNEDNNVCTTSFKPKQFFLIFLEKREYPDLLIS